MNGLIRKASKPGAAMRRINAVVQRAVASVAGPGELAILTQQSALDSLVQADFDPYARMESALSRIYGGAGAEYAGGQRRSIDASTEERAAGRLGLPPMPRPVRAVKMAVPEPAVAPREASVMPAPHAARPEEEEEMGLFAVVALRPERAHLLLLQRMEARSALAAFRTPVRVVRHPGVETGPLAMAAAPAVTMPPVGPGRQAGLPSAPIAPAPSSGLTSSEPPRRHGARQWTIPEQMTAPLSHGAASLPPETNATSQLVDSGSLPAAPRRGVSIPATAPRMSARELAEHLMTTAKPAVAAPPLSARFSAAASASGLQHLADLAVERIPTGVPSDSSSGAGNDPAPARSVLFDLEQELSILLRREALRHGIDPSELSS